MAEPRVGLFISWLPPLFGVTFTFGSKLGLCQPVAKSHFSSQAAAKAKRRPFKWPNQLANSFRELRHSQVQGEFLATSNYRTIWQLLQSSPCPSEKKMKMEVVGIPVFLKYCSAWKVWGKVYVAYLQAARNFALARIPQSIRQVFETSFAPRRPKTILPAAA